MKLKEIKWKEAVTHNTRTILYEGKIKHRIVGKIWNRGYEYNWVARLGIKGEVERGAASSLDVAKIRVSDALEKALIEKFFQES